MMGHLEQRQKSIIAKIPEIKKSMESVSLLASDKVLPFVSWIVVFISVYFLD